MGCDKCAPNSHSALGSFAMDHFATIDLEYAVALSNRATKFMAQNGIPPTPDNFQVWFVYYAGTSADLKRTIDVLISNKRTFDAAQNHELFRLVMDLGSGDASDASERLAKVVGVTREIMLDAVTGNREQMAAIHILDKKASNAPSQNFLRQLIEELGNAASRVARLEANLADSSRELESIRTSLQHAEEKSKIDPLTGLANRRALEEFSKAKQTVAMENGEPLSAMMMDVDHFKRFNDNYGHGVGDQVLKLIATTTKAKIRPEDLAARYGGEEIIVVLPCADLMTSAAAAERIRSAIVDCRITRRSSGEVLPSVSVSIGVAQFRPGESISDMIERCDQALYRAKRSGRNRVILESDEPEEALLSA